MGTAVPARPPPPSTVATLFAIEEEAGLDRKEVKLGDNVKRLEHGGLTGPKGNGVGAIAADAARQEAQGLTEFPWRSVGCFRNCHSMSLDSLPVLERNSRRINPIWQSTNRPMNPEQKHSAQGGITRRYGLGLLACLCLLHFSGKVSAQSWGAGDRIQIIVASAPVYQTLGGRFIGGDPLGTLGVVMGGPGYSGTAFFWNISFDTGVSGWVQQDFLAAIVPAAPSLISPGSASLPGTAVYTLTPTLTWAPVRGATNYTVLLAESVSGGFIGLYNNDMVGSLNALVLPTGLLAVGNTYTWTAQAQDSVGFSTASTPLYFQVQPPLPSAPALISPGASSPPGPSVATLSPVLSWTAAPGATNYGVYVYELPQYNYVYYNDTAGNVTSLQLPPDLLVNGHTNTWRVRASNESGFGSYSPYLFFQSPAGPPPSIQCRVLGNNLVLSWPTNSPGFSLESTTVLPALRWSPISPPPSIVASNYVVTNALSSGAHFFHLKQ